MKLGIDLDGVVYNFHVPFCKLAEKKLKRELDYPECWNFFAEQWGITFQEFDELMAFGVKYRNLWWVGPEIEGAKNGLQELIDDGHEIVIITHRGPKGAEMEARWATEHWLAVHRIPHHELFITHEKTKFDLDLIVEDAPKNVLAAQAAGEIGVCYTQPWNTDDKEEWNGSGPQYRVDNWEQVVKVVREINTEKNGS